MGTKISELSQVASLVTTADLLLVSQNNSGVYTSKKSSKSDLFNGWNDLLGNITTRNTGTAVPAYTQIGATGFYAYDFLGTGVIVKEVQCDFHIDHRYATGTDMYVHVHWMPSDTGAGAVKWYFQIAYAKGYSRGVYSVASPVTVSATSNAAGVAYTHQISEVQFSNNGGTGGLMDSNSLETDGILMIRVYRDPADDADTYASDAFVNYCDIHFQSNQPSTANRNYPFA